MEEDHRIRSAGECIEPRAGIHVHQSTGDRIEKRLQHVGNDNGVANGNAHGARQRQPADQATHTSHGLTPGRPCAAIGTQRAGAGTAADGVFRGKAHHAEQRHKKEVRHQKGKSAVAAHLGREAPHVGHAHGRAHSRQQKAPPAEISLFLLIHFYFLHGYLGCSHTQIPYNENLFLSNGFAHF